MPDWDPEANDLFLRALEVPQSDRERFLDEACAGNPRLRTRVDGLLRASERAGSFLGRPAVDPDVTATHVPGPADPALGTGTAVGPYKLIQELGAGGMGTVYLAQQTEPVRRLVALKVIKAGMDSEQVLARFEAERQALALMDHPNIAKVLDAGGTPTGRPYFVMELVKGVPITRHCDDHRLGVRERLGLFADVCRAVQHAHQKGVIHRDLKPSNVLVAPYDGRAVVKVIDFGIAKAAGQPLTDRTLVTGLGAVVGTAEYMSPEQAELNNLDVDTRSDVYSLGVLLYELLTGTTPLTRERAKGAALLEILRVVREEEPLRPSLRLSSTEELPTIAANRGLEPKKLPGLVRGELDWIVMKALEKDRTRRYETANGLVMDLERYLADEPVQACPPSAAYRLRKLVRRNKRLLTAAVAVAASLILGLAVVAVLLVNHAVEMQQEQKKTNSALEQAQGNLERADQNLALALEALDKVYMRRDPNDRNRILRDKRMEEVERKSLQTGLQFYERFAQQNAGQEKLQQATAQAYFGAGFLRQHLQAWTEAQDDYSKAIAIFEKWVDESHGPVRDQFDLASCYYGMTVCLQKTGQHGEAARMGRRAIALFEKLDADHKVSQDSTQMGYRRFRVELGMSLWQIADNQYSSGRPDQAEETMRQALRLFEGLLAEYPTEPFSRRKAGSGPRFDGDQFQTAVPLEAKYADCVGHVARRLAVELRVDRIQEKLALFQKAAEVYGKLTTAYPESTYFQHFEADTYWYLGDALSTLKRYDEAEKAFRKAADLFQKLPGGNFDPPDGYRNIVEEVRGYTALANFLTARNRPKDAEAVLGQAIALYEKFPNDPDSPLILGRLHSRLGQWDKVIADYSQAIAVLPKNSDLWSSRGFAYLSSRQWEKAIQDYTKAIELAPDVRANLQFRGQAYLDLGQWDKVVADFDKLLEKDPNDSSALYFRAVAYVKLNQPEQAVADLRQAFAKGYKDLQAIKKDDRFAPLRAREDFKKLLADMGK
jgi:serine/threonine protein kinase/tetratricopeptide (TPR) repeat protein